MKRDQPRVRIFGQDPMRCTKCSDGRLILIARWSPTKLLIEVVLANLLPRAHDNSHTRLGPQWSPISRSELCLDMAAAKPSSSHQHEPGHTLIAARRHDPQKRLALASQRSDNRPCEPTHPQHPRSNPPNPRAPRLSPTRTFRSRPRVGRSSAGHGQEALLLVGCPALLPHGRFGSVRRRECRAPATARSPQTGSGPPTKTGWRPMAAHEKGDQHEVYTIACRPEEARMRRTCRACLPASIDRTPAPPSPGTSLRSFLEPHLGQRPSAHLWCAPDF